MSNSPKRRDGTTDHLDEIEGIVGCTEIWERMNDVRNAGADTQKGQR